MAKRQQTWQRAARKRKAKQAYSAKLRRDKQEAKQQQAEQETQQEAPAEQES